MSEEKYASCIAACIECAQACERCADACLGEGDVGKMAECVRLDRDCSQVWRPVGLDTGQLRNRLTV